jgi:hypothetical protein
MSDTEGEQFVAAIEAAQAALKRLRDTHGGGALLFTLLPFVCEMLENYHVPEAVTGIREVLMKRKKRKDVDDIWLAFNTLQMSLESLGGKRLLGRIAERVHEDRPDEGDFFKVPSGVCGHWPPDR